MLDRIGQHNESLNAFITITGERALDQARKVDEEIQQGKDRGPLHGIPIAVKDLFATKGIRTTCGSKLFEDWIPDHDAAAVSRVLDAGAVLLGKTGLHELAYGNTSINPFYGAVRNPWATDHDPGGSSGGSASAVSAGLAFAALGTETGCSIRQPAHCCGIVGHKPTHGLVNIDGVQALVPTMDHVGPLTRSVGDAALLLDVLTGSNKYDCEGATLDGMRIGVVRDFYFEGYEEVISVVDEALDKLTELGIKLIDVAIPDVEQASKEARVTFAEANAVHADSLRENPQGFSEELRGRLAESAGISEASYAQALGRADCDHRCSTDRRQTGGLPAAWLEEYRHLGLHGPAICVYPLRIHRQGNACRHNVHRPTVRRQKGITNRARDSAGNGLVPCAT
jgi:aspartyl-tRNA(Asn)/glutamyl-tRNA(Gln) amidotransferase subunit A